MANVEATTLEKHIMHNLPFTLSACGFEIARNEVCDAFVSTLAQFARFISGHYAESINKQLTVVDNRYTPQDMISNAVGAVASIQDAIAILADEICDKEGVVRSNSSKITCQQASKHGFHLRAFYEKAVESWVSNDQLMPRGKKFQRKKRERQWHPAQNPPRFPA